MLAVSRSDKQVGYIRKVFLNVSLIFGIVGIISDWHFGRFKSREWTSLNCIPLLPSRCNYSIFLIVSRLRFKSTKLIFKRFTPPNGVHRTPLKSSQCEIILTISTLSKHHSLLTAKHQPQSWSREKFRENHDRITIDFISVIICILSVAAYDWTNSTNLVENYNMQIFKGI